MLRYDPVPWLMAQEGLAAVRGRRLLRLCREGDDEQVQQLVRGLARSQMPDGSFEHSPMKTAGVLNLLDDLRATEVRAFSERAASYLLGLLEAQPGYTRATEVRPGSVKTACDLCGFFGPYAERALPEALAEGAREMNFYRQYEPLLGPKSPVRGVRRSSLDRPGPGSCYAWGLIPLSCIVEALCRAGYAADSRLEPAVNALLGVQRIGGGWCRNLGGHPSCTVHALRAVGAHPRLRRSDHADRAIAFLRSSWPRSNAFAAVQAVAAFDSAAARRLLNDMLSFLAGRQRTDGTFGTPCKTERVVAVLVAAKACTA